MAHRGIRDGVQYGTWDHQSENLVSILTPVTNLRDFEERQGPQLQKLDNELRQLLTDLERPPALLHVLEHHELTELGFKLLDGSGKCPLCDTQWDSELLRKKLEDKLHLGEEAKSQKNKITKLTQEIESLMGFLVSSLDKVLDATGQILTESELRIFRQWSEKIKEFKAHMRNPQTWYRGIPSNDIVQGFKSPEVQEILSRLTEEIRAESGSISPKQSAYDDLVKLSQSVPTWQEEENLFRQAEKALEIAQTLREEFVASRDEVLNSLYRKISTRFEEIYRKLHFDDENNFSAELTLNKAGLDLKVDFYEYGKYSPMALHSEGHQDSMGLCLFLALAEEIALKRMNLIILDDVVTSVDADHRRALCEVLGDLFRDFQIIIATHDKTWGYQLQNNGVVRSQDKVEFSGWHIESGPRINTAIDVWEKIAEDISKNDISGAAQKLRYWGEMYFAEVCENLAAKVPYRRDARWGFGELFDPAIKIWKELIEGAIKAAHSWNNTSGQEELRGIKNDFEQIVKRLKRDQWVINSLVHYNPSADLSKNDFTQVSEAFRDLTRYFECSQCNAILRLDNPSKPMAVHCSCPGVKWDLKKKSSN